MNIYSVPDIFALIFNGSLAIRVFSQKGNGKVKYWLFSFLVLFVVWNLANLISLNVTDQHWVLLAAQITYRILFLMPAFILALSLNFWSRLTPIQTIIRNAIIFFLPIILLILEFPDFNFQLVERSDPQLMYYYTLVYSSNISFVATLGLAMIYLALSLVVTLIKGQNQVGIQRTKANAMLIFGLVLINILFFVIYIPYSQTSSYSFIYFLRTSFLFVEVFFFYAIISQMKREQKEHLPEKFLSYLIFTILVALYFVLIKVVIDLVDMHFSIHSFYFDAALIFILTLLFQPAESLIHQFVFHNIKNQLYQYRSNFLILTNELMEMFPDRQLLEKVREFIIENFQSEDVFLFRLNEDESVYEEMRLNDDVAINSFLVKLLQSRRKIVEFPELKREDVGNNDYEYFSRRDVRLFVPVMRGDKLIMFFALGRRTVRKDYSLDELEVLSIFSNEISLYLQRNIFFEKIQANEREKFRLEKLAALGQLTAGIAHEIRNPLNTISTATQTLMNNNLDNEVKGRMTQYIEEEVKRLSGLVNEFLELSRIRKPQYEEVDMIALFSKLNIFIRSKNDIITCTIENQINTRIYSDVSFLYQILSNLSLNALEALAEYCKHNQIGCKDAILRVRATTERNMLSLTVSNTGPEMPKEIKDRIFEPFFTTKEQGTGLGLSLVENMVKSLNGKIGLKSTSGITQFNIKIPLFHENKA
jgi:signal transduction histidine kinase